MPQSFKSMDTIENMANGEDNHFIVTVDLDKIL